MFKNRKATLQIKNDNKSISFSFPHFCSVGVPSAGPNFWELLGDFPSNKISSIKDTMVILASFITDKAIVLKCLLLMVYTELLLNSPAMGLNSCQLTTSLLQLLPRAPVWLLQE